VSIITDNQIIRQRKTNTLRNTMQKKQSRSV